MKFYQYLTLLCILGCFSFIGGSLYGQTDTSEQGLFILGKYDGNQVKVRWDPSSYNYFEKIKDHGVKIYRYTFRLDTGILTTQQIWNSEVVINSGVQPYSSSAIQNMNATSDMKSAITELLYNYQLDTVPTDTVRLYDIQKVKDAEENYIMMLSLLSVRDWEICKALGLGVVDTNNIQSNAKYRYIVEIQDSESKSFVYDINTGSQNVSKVPRISTQSLDHQILVKFYVSDLKDRYLGYYIERREKNGTDTFKRIQEEPFLSFEEKDKDLFQVYDSIPDNQTEYEYRIQGLDFFGDTGDFSNEVSASGKPPVLDARPSIDTVYPTASGIKLEFSFPDSLESNIQGFNVYNGKSIEGPYRMINNNVLSVQTREITDDSVDYINHYFVEAIDENDYSLMSFSYLYQPPDSTPPELPSDITGEISKSGKVEVEWVGSTSPDIYYYKVYFSYAKDSTYNDVSGEGAKKDYFSTGIDIKTLTKHLYVKVAAVDYRENISDLSEPIKLRIPDIIPPNKPVINYIRPVEFGVAIDWQYSSSDDIAYHKLERRKTNSGGWESLLELPYGDEEYYIPDITLNDDQQAITESAFGGTYKWIDTTVLERAQYEYRMLAIDSSDNIASSKPIIITTAGKFNPGSIYSFGCDNFSIEVQNRELYGNQGLIQDVSSSSGYKRPDINGILLHWQYTIDTSKVDRFIIYRARSGGAKFTPIGSVPANNIERHLFHLNDFGYTEAEWEETLIEITSHVSTKFYYTDFNVHPSRGYEYKVRAKLKDGEYSYMSEVNVCSIE